jgi:thiamine-monophosphate kinase
MRSTRTLAEVGERTWLDRVCTILSRSDPRLAVPAGDDAAVYRLGEGRCLILTTDAQTEGTHFKRSWLGWKGWARRALLAAASDVTAMGGTPTGFLASLGIPSRTRLAHIESFAQGLAELASEWNLSALGGDTIRSDRLFVDITVIGVVEEKDILRQTGARDGDAIWVTGGLGTSRALLTLLGTVPREVPSLDDPVWQPPARWPILDRLRKALPVRALTDISDGLLADMDKILSHRGLGADIQVERLPLSTAAQDYAAVYSFDPYECAFLGGEDYELLVVEKGDSQAASVFDLGGVALTRVGRVTSAGPGIKATWKGRRKRFHSLPFQQFG